MTMFHVKHDTNLRKKYCIKIFVMVIIEQLDGYNKKLRICEYTVY